jgi:hypothetical protein
MLKPLFPFEIERQFFAQKRGSALTFGALDEKFFARSRIKNRLL